MTDNTNKKTIEEESSLAEMLNHIKISELTERWKKYLDAALGYEKMTAEERDNVDKTTFDSEQYEALISDTYDAFAPYAFAKQVPKYVFELYATIRSFTEIDFIKVIHNGKFQIRTSIATSLYHLLDERTELSDEKRVVVFYLNENQTLAKAGYYIYDFDSLDYSYIGEKNPFA